jgi:hypothetical protein
VTTCSVDTVNRQLLRLSSNAAILIVATLQNVSETAYGKMILSL